MKMIRFLLACSAVLLLHSIHVSAQSTKPLETPDWVNMMEDPAVNYYAALASYETYWKTHKKPEGEEEVMERGAINPKETPEEAEKKEQAREKEERSNKNLSGAALERMEYLTYQSKRFENWAREVKPWVQEDGHILTYEDRQAIWEKQQEEVRQLNEKK